MTAPARPPEPEEAPMPAWVYVAGVLVILVVLWFVAMHFAGGLPQHLQPQ